MIKILQSRDLDIVFKTLLALPVVERRGWWVHMKIAEARKSVRDIALRHRITPHHLGNAIHGSDCAGNAVPWSPRIVKALQDDLRIDLTPFLTPKEAARLRKSR